ncbi:MAG: hypothetical protein HRT64_10490 [Erythrobacter sp.]|nr:hypothetical protein [Erythrobacter sp.]
MIDELAEEHHAHRHRIGAIVGGFAVHRTSNRANRCKNVGTFVSRAQFRKQTAKSIVALVAIAFFAIAFGAAEGI